MLQQTPTGRFTCLDGCLPGLGVTTTFTKVPKATFPSIPRAISAPVAMGAVEPRPYGPVRTVWAPQQKVTFAPVLGAVTRAPEGGDAPEPKVWPVLLVAAGLFGLVYWRP